jgi:hypothetical protein
LTIRKTKFRNDRLVPVHATTRGILRQYARDRDATRAQAAATSAEAEAAVAEAANARADLSSTEARISHYKLEIDRLRRQL